MRPIADSMHPTHGMILVFDTEFSPKNETPDKPLGSHPAYPVTISNFP